MSQNKNGSDILGDFMQEAYGEVSDKKSKNLSGEAYTQSSNTNLPGIIKTTQIIERLSKAHAFALYDCIYSMPHLKYFWIS